MRKRIFPAGLFYHVFNKSIAGYKIFQNANNANRFLKALNYYNLRLSSLRLSEYLRKKSTQAFPNILLLLNSSSLKFIAYTIMPTHYHIVIKVLKEDFVSKYINDVENSYTRFFNIKLKRKGPLWVSRFSYRRIKSNLQLLHTTRYVHLNATTDGLVEKPEDWPFSSYQDYITNPDLLRKTLTEITISTSKQYKQFVENRIDYQKKLKLIKNLILE